MRSTLLTSLLLLYGTAMAQTLQAVNFRYLYDLSLPLRFEMRLARGTSEYWIFYALHSDSSRRYEVSFSRQSSFQSQDSQPLGSTPQVLQQDARLVVGRTQTSLPVSPEVIVATVKDSYNGQEYRYPRLIDANYPATGMAMTQRDNSIVFAPFVNTGEVVKPLFDNVLQSEQPGFVFFYQNPFPPASPPMSTTGQVQAYFKADTVTVLEPGKSLLAGADGLYLIQQDSLHNEGIVLRAESDFPKYTQLSKLVAPLSYITTREEYASISAATGDKKTFDMSILAIAQTQDRARALIRNYFRRIEQANILFTSYKEGWKTDRGMIFTIYGLPDEVKMTGEREIWTYVNNYGKVQFDFFRAGSIFDPENYVLQRDRKFGDSWYLYIDLWRKARF